MAVAKPVHQLKLAGHLQTRAAFEPSSFNAEKGTAELVFTTGARGLRQPWFGDDYFEELEVSESAVDLSRLNNGASLLAAHDGYSLSGVIGVVERAWIAGKEGRALVRFSDRDDVKPIRIDVASGVLRHVSVGYTVQKYEKTEEEGNKIPILRATRWTPAEISLVPIAFDDAATVRSSAQPQPYDVEVVTPPQEQERNMADPTKQTSIPAVVSTPATAATPAVPAASTVAESTIRAHASDVDQGVKAERERATTIRSLMARQTLLAEAVRTELTSELLDKGVQVDEARALILERLATESDKIRTDQHVRIESGEDTRDKFGRGVTAWLVNRGAAQIVELATATNRAGPKKLKELEGIDLDPGEFRYMTLRDLARDYLERVGVKVRGRDSVSLVGDAFMHRSSQGVADFAVMFEVGLGKILLAAYAVTEDTWSKFCGTTTVPDFRDSPRYRSGSLGSLDSLTEQGEYKNKTLPDAAKTNVSTATKGNIVGLTRAAIINDDMGALVDVTQKLGRAAALTIEKEVYALITANAGLGPTQTDAQPFFHANRANVNGTGSALTVAALEADASILAAQMDAQSNEYLSLNPAILLVPYGLRGTAITVNEAQFDPADSKFQKPNYVRGLVRSVVATHRLTATSVTRRYLFADPTLTPAVLVAFLEGQPQGPVLSSQEGWRNDGIEWKVRIDEKAQMFDPKGAVTNAGT